MYDVVCEVKIYEMNWIFYASCSLSRRRGIVRENCVCLVRHYTQLLVQYSTALYRVIIHAFLQVVWESPLVQTTENIKDSYGSRRRGGSSLGFFFPLEVFVASFLFPHFLFFSVLFPLFPLPPPLFLPPSLPTIPHNSGRVSHDIVAQVRYGRLGHAQSTPRKSKSARHDKIAREGPPQKKKKKGFFLSLCQQESHINWVYPLRALIEVRGGTYSMIYKWSSPFELCVRVGCGTGARMVMVISDADETLVTIV